MKAGKFIGWLAVLFTVLVIGAGIGVQAAGSEHHNSCPAGEHRR